MASKPVGIIMASVAALLDSPRAVRSPILHDKAVKLLLAMLGPQLDVARRTAGGGLGRTAMMPGEGRLGWGWGGFATDGAEGRTVNMPLEMLR